MASNQSFVGFEEGRSITCPPLFKGDTYFQWCHQMEFFIKALDFDLWEIIEEGFVEGPKKKKNRSSKDMGKAKLNAKAMHTLICGLNDDVFKNVSSCKSAKEMWEKLEKLYKKEEMKCAKVDDKSAHEEPEVSSNSYISCSYSFDELVFEFKNHILKNKKVVSNLKIQNDLISKTNDELEAKLNEFEQNNVNLQNLLQSLEKDHQKEVDDLKKEKDLISKELEKKNNFGKSNFYVRQSSAPRFIKGKCFRSIWVPKGLTSTTTGAMASNQSFVGFEEGRSITCPHLFKGDSYFQWCHQMEFFIKALDFDLWEIIEEGFVEGPKKKKNMSSKDMGKAKLNAKAMHTLICGLNDDVFKNVSSCKSAKEMWEKLEKLYKKEDMKCAKDKEPGK
ncbi:hypothetical protein GQ457_03G006520 [Hibiscus cannabinus]